MSEQPTENLSSLRTVDWKDNKVVMIDQTKLPNDFVFVEYDDFNQVANAIRTLVVRGAPAIGVSGAFGLALAVLQSKATTKDELLSDLENAKNILFETRPTAVNLGWGLEKIMNVATSGDTIEQIKELVISTAKKMADEDIEINKTMGKNGSVLFDDNDTIMTHCNAGALATVGYGTALGVIRATKESGKNVKVIVGADRIVKTGHVFNKIGTYQVATMAKQHGIPFYVAAPLSTIDMETKAEDVIIEMRKGSEVTGIGEKKTAPDDIGVINPAFDMTPPDLISGIITEKGVVTAPFEESISKLFQAN